MYEVNILVNGSRCKQYNHQGNLYIEAKNGSEYTIEIKNSTWQRILAVCSVDGLDILTGKRASENAAGYVINGYNNAKLDGFRVSDNKVAKFVFGAKGESYAASKEDGSERNVGVIAVRLFQEKIKPPPPPVEVHHHHHHDHYKPWNWPYTTCGSSTGDPPPPPSTTIWCDTTISNTLGDHSLDWMEPECERGPEKYSCDHVPTKGAPRSANPLRSYTGKISSQGMKTNSMFMSSKKANFDMGTKWGEAKESRVFEVEFEKGFLALTANIYYASRHSLIEMGIPLGNEKQVSFPEPFPADSKYAKPPKNWQG